MSGIQVQQLFGTKHGRSLAIRQAAYVVIWAVGTEGDELDPIFEVVRGVQANFLEKMPTAPFNPSFLHQTTGTESTRGTKLGDLVDNLVNELLWEVGHGGGWFASSDEVID